MKEKQLDLPQTGRAPRMRRFLILLAAALGIFGLFRKPIAHQNMIRGDTFLAANMFFRAEMQYKKALLLCPRSSDAYNGLAFSYERAGKVDEAIRTLERSFSRAPGNDVGCVELGRIMLLKKGQPAKAIGLFSRAKEINPGNREAHIWLVVHYKSIGEYSEARAVLREMLEKFTGDPWAQERLRALEAGHVSAGGRQKEQ